MKDVKPNAAGESQEVKVKVRIDHNGILFISSASMVEKRETEAENGAAEQNETAGEQMDCQEVRIALALYKTKSFFRANF